jgi:hypothetical protein
MEYSQRILLRRDMTKSQKAMAYAKLHAKYSKTKSRTVRPFSNDLLGLARYILDGSEKYEVPEMKARGKLLKRGRPKKENITHDDIYSDAKKTLADLGVLPNQSS